ncbi:MAG TPA: lysylphosphatidylglycerol synthase transmembrane domain-containing protein [Pyrinomonadaceae bacterium]|nr:lysylphosphatidylglycerol synthase transmembrane domain-containing protein [Pyrinomonadaceae bacterium]
MRKHLKFIALILLAALILWWFGRGLDWKEVGAAVGAADWRLLAAAVLVICAGYLIRAYRWRVLLAPLAPARLREVFVATSMGFAAIFVFGRAGEVVRPVVLPLREKRVRPAASFVTIAVERICDMSLVAMLFALNLLWFPVPAERAAEFANIRRSGLVLLVAIVLGLLGLAWFKRRSKGAVKWVDKTLRRIPFMPKRVADALVHLLEQLARALSIFVDAREFLMTAAWSVSLWVAIGIATWCILHAFGLDFGAKQSLFVMCWGLVGSMVPTPGGSAGAFHATTQYGLHTFLGVDTNKAAAIAIIMHLVFFGPALFFGLYYFLRGEVSLSAIREMAKPEAVEHAIEDEELEVNRKTATETV